MEGSLLERGIGWYLTPEDVDSGDYGLDVGPNPGNIAGLGLAMIYLLWPIDLIPDNIPVIGYMDDLAVIRFSYSVGGVLYDIFN